MADPEVVPDVEKTEAGGEEEPTSEEPSSQGDDAGQPAVLASQLMKDPIMLAALQDKLGSMVGGSSGYIQSLPKPVKRRLKALKKIQFEATKIEAEFYREVHRLECEYAAKYAPLFDKRATVVTGEYEPNDEEADWPSDDEKEDELAKGTAELASGDAQDEVKNKASLDDKEKEKKEENEEETKGIPGFWLTIFKNVDMLSEMIQPHDEPILNHLQDIKVEFTEKDPMGFTLEFFFEPNEFFDNKKLTKVYIMRSEPEEGDPFSFEGPEIIKCNGCKIDWKKGKNVTVKTVKKKQKHKASGTTRTIQKTVQSDSFFNFFSPPTSPEDEEMDEDTEALLAADFEIGHFIRERIVPRAVLYFTGEALENDEDDDYGEEEEGAEEGEYDEDADPDYHPGKGKYISREFQELCAQLALGRVSKPSSAPCDTRLALRPSSGSAIRRDTPVQTDLSARPRTAPLRSPHLQNHNLQSVISKPDVNTEAFSENDRPKTGVLHDKHERTFIREGTEIMLPNALTPEDVIDAKLSKQRKVKENTHLSVRHEVRKPPERMSREKTFLKSPRRKMMKPSKQFENHLGQDIIDSVEEYSDLDDKRAEDEKLKQNTEQKMSDKKSASSVKTEDSKHIRPFEMEETKAVEKHVKRETANAGNKSTKSSGLSTRQNRVKQGQQKYGSVKSAGSYNSKDTVHDKPSTKEAAFSILQKLTGKRQEVVHEPGQVPSVNKPRRKYKFTPPRNDTDIQKPQEKQKLDNLETDTRKDKESKNSEVEGEKGNKTTGKHVQIRKEMMKKQSLLPGSQGRFETEESVEVDKRKPVSAPVRNRKPGTGTSGKYPVYETKDTVCKPKQVSLRESQSAQPRLKQERETRRM